MDKPLSRSFNEDSLSASFGRNNRLSPSPSRPHHLNALSPLQAFSPLNSHQPLREHNVNSGAAPDERAEKRRPGGLTRSLSRRQSLIASAEEWRQGYDPDDSVGDASSLFSRITLVKAPTEGASLRRAKSSSSITPFSAGTPIDAPATSARGPRRSFAAASFAGFSPMTAQSLKTLPAPYSPHGPDVAGRVLGSESLGIQRKVMSPEEVLDVARSLSSPVAMPEGGLKRAELKRRKSAGAASRSGSKTSLSPEKPPLALEPVEYVQLDDNTLLPFVDRPQEVTELMNHPSNTALFKLLQAAFPKNPAREHWKALSPGEWNWEEFVKHLTQVTRAECPDYAWVFRAREAVRTRSVALWEKLGVCLGCDGDLLNAGGEDGSPPSWGGLGLGEEGEYDPSANHVWIEGLEAVDPNEQERIEREFRDEFGDIVEDENEQAAAGMTALLGTVGEETEEVRSIPPRQTAAQREANRKLNPVDPMNSPTFAMGSLPPETSALGHSPYTPHSPARFGTADAKGRSKSFVGLQILTSPVQPLGPGLVSRSPIATTPNYQSPSLPVYDRGPGSPLFPSSFSSLSVEPNLGRSASVALGGAKAAHPVASAYEQGIGLGMDRGDWGIRRKASGAGLSESAITFASESDYSHSAPDDHERRF